MARKFSSSRNEEDEQEVDNLTNFPNNSETISNPPRTPQRRSSPESPSSLTEPPGDQCKSFLTGFSTGLGLSTHGYWVPLLTQNFTGARHSQNFTGST